MAESVFDDKSLSPGLRDLEGVLGDSFRWFEGLSALVSKEGTLIYDWKYYGRQSGWVLKMLRGKRNILFVIPGKGYFRVALTFGDKALQVILKADLPQQVKETLNAAKPYAEGRTIQPEVRSDEQYDIVRTLVEIKLTH